MYATLRFVAVVLAASVVAALLPGPAWLDLLAVNLAALVALAIDVRTAPGPASLQATWDVPDVVALDRPAKGTLRLHNPTGRRLKVATHEAAAPSTGLYPARQGTVLDAHGWGALEEDIIP
ncbi:MAG: hypothetical protein QOD01_2391, partial [Actinomycetota bacterium]|nr:hypothetical protein [Actinomycetota bacterium]